MKANLSDFSVGEKIILDIYTDMDWVVNERMPHNLEMKTINLQRAEFKGTLKIKVNK